MPQIYYTPHHIPRPQTETQESPYLAKPSGELFKRPSAGGDITYITSAIDETLIQNQVAPESMGPQHKVEHLGNAAICGQVLLAAEAFPGQWQEASARNARILGRAAIFLANKNELSDDEAQKSLSRLFKRAHENDQVAMDVLKTDAASSVVEMVCKTGARMRAEADIVNGAITQYGRTTEQRQFNTRTTFTHKFPGLDAMSNAEGQNALALEQAIAAGRFKKGDLMVECSLVPDAQYADLKDSGLFLREMIAIIRLTRVEDNNKVVIESYLVCGTDQSKLPAMDAIKTKDDEEEIEKLALENRFDIKAFRELLHRLGVKGTADMSPTDILSTPLFVAGQMAASPLNGTAITMAYDETVAKITGQPVMMGSAELYKKATKGHRRSLIRADYESHFARMDELQKNLQPIGQDVARQCAEYSQEVEGNDYAAGRLMHKLSEQAVLKYFADTLAAKATDSDTHGRTVSPDMTVMGILAYHNLMAFQEHLARGDILGAEKAFSRAAENARGTGCPSGAKNRLGEEPNGPNDGEGSSTDDKELPPDKYGSRVFNCPNCKKENRREKRDELLEECQHCHKKIPRCGPSGGGKKREDTTTGSSSASKKFQFTLAA